jgi:anaerobic ribonucleoside-triphosphate reductase
MAKCGRPCEIYSRVCGYFRPVSNWNRGKKQEFKDRKTFKIPKIEKGESKDGNTKL